MLQPGEIVLWKTFLLCGRLKQAHRISLGKKSACFFTNRKRSRTLPVFTHKQIMVIIDLAYQNPCDSGYEASQRILPLLAAKIKKQGSTDQISEKPPLLELRVKMEFDYIRHGTVSLICFFDAASSRMQVPYLNSSQKEEYFAKAVKVLVNTDSGTYWMFICNELKKQG